MSLSSVAQRREAGGCHLGRDMLLDIWEFPGSCRKSGEVRLQAYTAVGHQAREEHRSSVGAIFGRARPPLLLHS